MQERIWRALVLAMAGFIVAGVGRADETASDVLSGSVVSEIQKEATVYVPDSSSPQATMASFQEVCRQIGDIFQQSNAAGSITAEQEQQLIDLYARMTSLLDVSELPDSERFALAHVAGTQISEVLDRIRLPAAAAIPDAKEAEAQGLKYWRIPDTHLTLTRITEGPRTGDWVFDAHTVSRIDELYRKARPMPYRPDANVGRIGEVGGLLNHYMVFTGPVIPYSFTSQVPPWARVELFANPLWKYLATFLTLALMVAVALLVQRLTRFRSDTRDTSPAVLMHLRRLVLPVAVAAMLLMVSSFVIFEIRLREGPMELVNDLLLILFYLVVFWIIICVGNLIGALILSSRSMSSRGIDASLVRLSTRVIAYIVGFWVLIDGVERLGLSLVPLIAGVSIGGLAFAMAARPTLGNLLAGILIFADRPFKVGDRVMISDNNGTIEDIGLRSTRMRTLDGHQVTIPNEDICNSQVINIARRPNIRRLLNVTVTYDTSVEKIEQAKAIIRELLSEEIDGGKSEEELGRPANGCVNDPDFPPRILFTDFNADSLNIQVLYWFTPPDYKAYLVHADWFNRELLRRFNDAGIDFAFPTQTIELKTEPGTAA